MTGEPAARLSSDEVGVLRFAVNRQLSRWARPGLSTHQQVQRAALRHAARVLREKAFSPGCELHPVSESADG